MIDNIVQIFDNNSATVDLEALKNNISFKDSGVDSLDLMNILLEVEQEFDISIEDDEYQDINNLESLLKVVEAKCK